MFGTVYARLACGAEKWLTDAIIKLAIGYEIDADVVAVDEFNILDGDVKKRFLTAYKTLSNDYDMPTFLTAIPTKLSDSVTGINVIKCTSDAT